MKKIINNLVISSCLLYFTDASILAQTELIAYTWDDYSIAFSIPENSTILENDSVKFSAGDTAINLTIYPVDASGIDSSNMEAFLQEWAVQNNVEVLSNYERFNDSANYFGVLCAGNFEQYNVMLLLLIDPNYNDLGFYIWISYIDSSFDMVMKMIDSIYPI